MHGISTGIQFENKGTVAEGQMDVMYEEMGSQNEHPSRTYNHSYSWFLSLEQVESNIYFNLSIMLGNS